MDIILIMTGTNLLPGILIGIFSYSCLYLGKGIQKLAIVGHQHPLTAWPARNEKSYSGGITAVFSSFLTRESIFHALEDQRIFALSDYGRPYLDFSINGMSIQEDNNLLLDSPRDVRKIRVMFAQNGA